MTPSNCAARHKKRSPYYFKERNRPVVCYAVQDACRAGQEDRSHNVQGQGVTTNLLTSRLVLKDGSTLNLTAKAPGCPPSDVQSEDSTVGRAVQSYLSADSFASSRIPLAV